jgi:hypothetical protein
MGVNTAQQICRTSTAQVHAVGHACCSRSKRQHSEPTVCHGSIGCFAFIALSGWHHQSSHHCGGDVLKALATLEGENVFEHSYLCNRPALLLSTEDNHTFRSLDTTMEAERVNQIGNLLNDLQMRTLDLRGIFDFDAKSERLRTVNASLEDPSVWDDPKKAQELGKEKKTLDDIVVTLAAAGTRNCRQHRVV